ncbi:MAG: restriction endonuclease [Pseudoxanthomonas sp.]
MSAWLFGSVITLLVGTVITAYLWLIRRRDDETSAGLLALAGMRWRDFSRLVLEAMELRGLERIPSAHEENQEHSSSFLLSGQGRQLLLACKHGSAYRIGSAAVDEFASEIRLRGVQGGILVTEGVLDKGGIEKAGRHNIEVIDGPLLWPAVKPMVEGNLQRRIVDTASARARRHIGIAWLGALTLGLASALVFPGAINPAPSAAAPAAASVAVPPAQPTAALAATRVATPKPIAAANPEAVTEAETDKHRAEVSRKLSRTSGISRGVWISRSTLSVDRIVAEEAAWPLVCRQLKPYPDLGLTRVQMNPPEGSTDPVRWRQCESL